MVTHGPRQSIKTSRLAQKSLERRYADKYRGLFSMEVWLSDAIAYAEKIHWDGCFDRATPEQIQLFHTWMDHRGWAR